MILHMNRLLTDELAHLPRLRLALEIGVRVHVSPILQLSTEPCLIYGLAKQFADVFSLLLAVIRELRVAFDDVGEQGKVEGLVGALAMTSK